METDLKKDQNNVTNTEQPSSSILSQVRIMKSYHDKYESLYSRDFGEKYYFLALIGFHRG